jgi:hypothetical protein
MTFELALAGAVGILTLLYWSLSVKVAAQEMMIGVLLRLFFRMVEEDNDEDD